jgi:hypothetical protein
MRDLAKVGTLKSLWIDRTAVGDRGMRYFANHPTLRWVKADSSQLTDASIPTFMKMPALQSLNLRKTKVTPGAVDRLKAARPKLRVSY